jgi:hypothetical protein
MHGARDCPLSIYKTFENDARALLLTNARQDLRDRARYWRGDGDASNCFFIIDSRNSVVGIRPLKINSSRDESRYSDKDLVGIRFIPN